MNLYSNFDYLADSGSSGRVVVVSGEATSQKYLTELKARLAKARDQKVSELDERFNAAMSTLRGNN